MLTSFGKFCRKLRIDKNELLKGMASKLNVTSAYLSAVENGKRKIPDNWIKVLPKIYDLNEAEINELRESYDLSISEIKIDLGSANSNQKKIVTSFARKFHSLDDDDLSKIKRLLNKKDR